jgi:hypothetical protein
MKNFIITAILAITTTFSTMASCHITIQGLPNLDASDQENSITVQKMECGRLAGHEQAKV